jgi:hypothetical protein
MINACKIIAIEPQTRHRWEDNIKMFLKENRMLGCKLRFNSLWIRFSGELL